MSTDVTSPEKPKYPVIDPNPSVTNIIDNFNTVDYLQFLGITGVSLAAGYLSGVKSGKRGSSVATGGMIGVWFGFMQAYQSSAGRLMGVFPNDGEVARNQKREFTN